MPVRRASLSEDRPDIRELRFDKGDIADIQAWVAQAIQRRERTLIANHNMHSMWLYGRDSGMRQFYRHADKCLIDGLPIIAVARVLGVNVGRRDRLGALDWGPPLLARAAAEDWRVFYLGSEDGVAARAAAVLCARHPGLKIRTRSGHFDADTLSDDNKLTIEAINDFAPHILLVGMGMPRQEQWILANWDRLDANAVFNVGAFFDYIAGEIPSPPRWLGPLGLEWLYRLGSEPRRLWRRYLVEPWAVLKWALPQLMRLRRSQSS